MKKLKLKGGNMGIIREKYDYVKLHGDGRWGGTHPVTVLRHAYITTDDPQGFIDDLKRELEKFIEIDWEYLQVLLQLAADIAEVMEDDTITGLVKSIKQQCAMTAVYADWSLWRKERSKR